MKRTDLAYIAGIVDGEGCIGLNINRSKTHTSYRVKVAVANSNEWICQWLKLAFGGCVNCTTYSHTRKPMWQWITTANQAVTFLILIRPYLHLKQAQADLAISYQSSRIHHNHLVTDEERAVAEAQRIVMGKLNQKGIEGNRASGGCALKPPRDKSKGSGT